MYVSTVTIVLERSRTELVSPAQESGEPWRASWKDEGRATVNLMNCIDALSVGIQNPSDGKSMAQKDEACTV